MKIFCLFFVLLCSTPGTWATEILSPTDVQFGKFENMAIIFLSRSCPCSQSHINHLNILAKNNILTAFYGVITDDPGKMLSLETKAYYKSINLSFPLVEDRNQALVKKYGALKTPHVVLARKNPLTKTSETLYEGGLSDHRIFSKAKHHFLSDNLRALEKNKNQQLPYRFGKSLGCYIRRL